MSLIELSLKRPKFITMLTIFFVILGVLALFRLPVDLYPRFDTPVIVVRTSYSGASPEEIEELITKKIEDELSTLSSVQTMRSISRLGMSIIILEFTSNENIRFEEMQVRSKVANIKKSLPDDVEEPIISRQDPDDTPIMEFVLSGDTSLAEISDQATLIADQLRQIEGVGEVNVSGDTHEEVVVDLKKEAIHAYSINPTEVIKKLTTAHQIIPLGTLDTHSRSWSLKYRSTISTLKDLMDFPLSLEPPYDRLTLGDVGHVYSGFKKRSKINRVHHVDAADVVPSVSIEILKQSGENTLKISERVHLKMSQIEKNIPQMLNLRVIQDQAKLIRSNILDVFESLIIGVVLTTLVILLFLRSLKSTLTTAISIPSSILSTFAVMKIFGFSVNIMTLLALSLSIGILVDDAIVVRENIFKFLKRLSPFEAAKKGTLEVQLAVVATTLSLASVFIPVSFIQGMTGEFFKQFALTVVFSVMMSLWDALTMAPMLSCYFANHSETISEWKFLGDVEINS